MLDSLDAVCGFTVSMTWKDVHPVVELVTAAYASGVTLIEDNMAAVETQFVWLCHLDK